MKPPITMPNIPAVSTHAKAERSNPHSPISAGTAAPSSWLSSPSKIMVSAVVPTSTFWYPLQCPSSRSEPTSVVVMADSPVLFFVDVADAKLGEPGTETVEVQPELAAPIALARRLLLRHALGAEPGHVGGRRARDHHHAVD